MALLRAGALPSRMQNMHIAANSLCVERPSIRRKEPVLHTVIAPFGILISTLGCAGLGVQFPRSEYF